MIHLENSSQTKQLLSLKLLALGGDFSFSQEKNKQQQQ